MKAKLKKMVKKKSFWVIAVLVIILVIIAVFAIRVHSRIGKMADAQAQSVQSMVVEKGSVSNSIEGSGNLESAAEVDVTAPTGIEVDEVLVESGDKVTKGQKLATIKKSSVVSALVDVEESLDAVEDELSDSDLTALEKEELTDEQSDLQKAQEQLNALYENPVLTATADGVIGSVNVSAGSSISSSGSSGSSSSGGSSGGSSMSGFTVGSNTDETGTSEASAVSVTARNKEDNSADTSVNDASVVLLSGNANTGVSGNIRYLSGNTGNMGTTGNAGTTDSGLAVIKDYPEQMVETPIAGKIPQTKIEETSGYTGTITWEPSDAVFQIGISYVATVELTAKEGYTFVGTTLPEMEDATKVKETIHASGDTMTLTVTYPKTGETQNDGSSGSGSQNGGQSGSDVQSGSQNAGQSGSDAQSGSSSQLGSSMQSGSGSQNVGSSGYSSGSSLSGASLSASSVSGSSISGSSSSSASLYSAYEAAAFTIETMEQVKVSISVDELDILSVEEGQTAEITLDALEDQTFEGEVTRVSNSATTGSGSAKYTVEITIPMDENMRIGMSASASIKVSEAADALVIPMDALQQKGEELFVYTQTDEEGNLSGAVTVETGVSDGTNVEITSGLSEGDTIYYLSSENDSQMLFPGGMGGFGGGGGEMPGGGSGDEMPGGADGGSFGGRGSEDSSGGGMPSGDR